MQTLNLVENTGISLNAFKLFDTRDHENNYRKLALAEQLQTSLDLEHLLNIFSMEAAKYVDFSGIYFKNQEVSASVRGSKAGKKERLYELKLDSHYLGTLTYATNSPISITNHKVLTELHQLLVHPINNAIKYQQALKIAMEDGLTGLGNRRHFDQQLKRAMHNANRQQSRLGIVVCDLNKFKAINDNFGHNIGDDVLIEFANALRQSTRDSDTLSRFGGDEFAIIVENASEQSLQIIERRIEQAIEKNALLHKYKVSSSLGYTFMNRADNEKSLFERADNMLYRRKMNMQKALTVV
ncbi:GGDEF domain-containing protein [Thalassotalea piscium]